MPFPPDPPLHAPRRRPTPDLPLAGLTLLIVDDSRYACDALRLILHRAGARLRRADSLTMARRNLAAYRPNLAIVDAGLPDGDGEGLVATLAQQGIPTLGLSGDPDRCAAMLRAGAAAFLDKPILDVAGLVRLVYQLAVGPGPDRLGPDLSGPDPPRPTTDAAALRDDLALAADLIRGTGSPGYALAFVRGLARTANDADLEAATQGAEAPPDLDRLARMIEARLTALPSLG